MMQARTRVAGLAALVLTAQASAQTERYDGEGWSFLPPEGWVAMDEAHLEGMNLLLRHVAGNDRQRYVAGFADPSLWPDGEYVLVQLNDNPFVGISERELVNAFGALPSEVSGISERISEGTGRLIRDVQIGGVVYDPDRRRFLMRSQSSVDGEPLEGFSVLYPGRMRGIQLNWFAPLGELDASLPMFTASTDSFAWDDGQAWTPAMSRGWKILMYVFVGAAAAGLAPLVSSLAKKGRKGEQRETTA